MGDSFVQRSPFRPLGPRCTVRAFSRLFLSFPAFSCLFGLLAFMCTVHVFSPTFCGLSRRRLRGSELVRAWVRRLLRSPLPCGVPRGLERPLFRWRWRWVANFLAVGWCCVLASPFLAVRHWNSDSPALRSEKSGFKKKAYRRSMALMRESSKRLTCPPGPPTRCRSTGPPVAAMWICRLYLRGVGQGMEKFDENKRLTQSV